MEQAQLIYLRDKRSLERRVVNYAASLREAGSAGTPVRLIDISKSGCKISSPAAGPAGEEHWFKFSGVEPIRARLVWLFGEQAGFEFLAPLTDDQLLRIRRKSWPLPAEARGR